MSSPARHFCSAVSYAASQAAHLALEERPASCPYTRAECLAAAGPGAGPSPTQRPASPFTWWMAASRRPRRTRSSSAPRRWLEAVTRTCSCSSTRPYQATASARWLLGGGRGCKRAQDALPTSTPAPPDPHQFRGSSLGIPAADLLGDLGQVPIPLWASDSAFPGTEKARGHSGKPKDPPLPWEMPWESELDRSGFKSQHPP